MSSSFIRFAFYQWIPKTQLIFHASWKKEDRNHYWVPWKKPLLNCLPAFHCQMVWNLRLKHKYTKVTKRKEPLPYILSAQIIYLIFLHTSYSDCLIILYLKIHSGIQLSLRMLSWYKYFHITLQISYLILMLLYYFFYNHH